VVRKEGHGERQAALAHLLGAGGGLRSQHLFLCHFLLGIALIIFSVRGSASGGLKKFFLLTGASAAGILVSIALHNLVYGLFEHFAGADFWNGGDEFFFFTLAVIVCPLGFLVGLVGTIVLGVKKLRAA
jgi:hypothetical protein